MFSLLESALCLWIQVHPLWIQGLKRLVLWTQNLTLLEDHGLWIQTIVLHCSCAKAVSISIYGYRTFRLFQNHKSSWIISPTKLQLKTKPQYTRWIVEEEVLYTWLIDSMTTKLTNYYQGNYGMLPINTIT